MNILTPEQKDEIHDLEQLRKYYKEELGKIEAQLRSCKSEVYFPNTVSKDRITQFLEENFVILPSTEDFDKQYTAQRYRTTFRGIGAIHGISVTYFHKLLSYYLKIRRTEMKQFLETLGIQTKSQCYPVDTDKMGQVLLGVFPNVESVLWDCLDPEEDTILIKWIAEQRNG